MMHHPFSSELKLGGDWNLFFLKVNPLALSFLFTCTPSFLYILSKNRTKLTKENLFALYFSSIVSLSTSLTQKQTLTQVMKTLSISTIFAIAFLFISSMPVTAIQPTNHGFQGSKTNCTYSIEIETTCAQSAGTTDHVSIRFGDSDGHLIIVKHLNNPKLLYAPKGGPRRGGHGGFGRCAVDVFEASGPCMSQRVCSLYLKKVGSDDWRPGKVKVLHRQDGGRVVPVSYVFYYRTFVPENVWYGFNYCSSKGAGFVPHVVSFEE